MSSVQALCTDVKHKNHEYARNYADPECPYGAGTYAADRWAHHVAAQLCGLKKPLTALDDRGQGGYRAAQAGELVAEFRRLERECHILLFVTINHPHRLEPTSITDGTGTAWMQEMNAATGAEWSRIEYAGRRRKGTGLHMHAVVPFEQLERLQTLEALGYNIHFRALNPSKDALYCTKSPFDWTAITNHHRHVTAQECQQATRAYLDGLEQYQQTTGKKQPPKRSGWASRAAPSSRGLGYTTEYDNQLTPNPDHDHDDRDNDHPDVIIMGEEQYYSVKEEAASRRSAWLKQLWVAVWVTVQQPKPNRAARRARSGRAQPTCQQRRRVAQPFPLAAVSFKAQQSGNKPLQTAPPLYFALPSLPDNSAVPPPRVAIIKGRSEARSQPPNQRRPSGVVGMGQLTQPIHQLLHVLHASRLLSRRHVLST